MVQPLHNHPRMERDFHMINHVVVDKDAYEEAVELQRKCRGAISERLEAIGCSAKEASGLSFEIHDDGTISIGPNLNDYRCIV